MYAVATKNMYRNYREWSVAAADSMFIGLQQPQHENRNSRGNQS